MRNKFYIIINFLLISFLYSSVFAENLSIQSKKIEFDKKNQKTIFTENVIFKTEDDETLKSEYAEYDKLKGLIILKNQVTLIDKQNNAIETEYAEYFENKKIFLSKGSTKIKTIEGYVVEGKDFTLNNKNESLTSKEKATISDLDGNQIFLDNFEFLNKQNIFKSIGFIQIKDRLRNTYEFSQIYIDTKKKEILGTDIKAFINSEEFKIHQDNKPRIFANSVNLNKEKSTYNKSIFTLCDYRENDKCPPWSIQSSRMLHDNKKKTIYYNNALIKVYNIPIFYVPRLSHPDPSVDRRSGFLPPSISNTKNLGFGVAIPYFFAIDGDKNLTLNSRIFANENPLFLGEYHQVFKSSSLIADFGFTEGYKKTSSTKKPGQKSHLFTSFVKNFKGRNDSQNKIELTFQDVSNDKYFKLYGIKTNLADKYTDVLENSFKFTHSNEKLFVDINASVFETLSENYNDKYEYILPEIALRRNLLSNNFGTLDLQSILKIHNYDTNKVENFLVNNFYWKSKKKLFETGISSQLLGEFKNVNYDSKNVDLYKKEVTSEMHGALGILSELKLEKIKNTAKHFLTPKVLLRYSPGSMREDQDSAKLNTLSAFSMNKSEDKYNFEKGLSGSVGLNYKIKNNDKKEFDFSIAQVINEKENKKMSSKSSLDEKLSDLVGTTSYNLGNGINLKYDFAIDQNYSEFNYNELGLSVNNDLLKVDFSYLQEAKHIGNQEYFKTKIDLKKDENGLLSFETKRDLIKNSSEFYKLSYEYINDCLRAGLVYRREFYIDSEVEPENSLMFKITLTPFGSIEPSIGK